MIELSLGGFKIHVEVPLLLAFYAFTVSGSVYTNLVIYRTCYVILGYNKSDCALLGNGNETTSSAALEKLVEPTASVIGMVKSIVEASVCAILCIFIGPWSDRFGRKPVLVISQIGFTVGFVMMAVFSSIDSMSPWWFMLSSIPVMLSGGASSFLTSILSHITDVTNEKNRGLRMGIFEAVLAAGILIGNVTSSYLLYSTNYASVFTISAVCCLMATVFTIFFIPESLSDRSTEGMFKNFFQLTSISDMAVTTFKRRENYKRASILSIIAILSIYIFVINGDGSVVFYYLREKFDWSLKKYTLYSSAHNIAWILGTLFGVAVLHNLLNVTETILILCGLLSMLNSALLQGLATNDYFIYAGGLVRCLGGVISPMARSIISKLVPTDEVGKIFAAIIIFESMLGMLSSPLYVEIYNSTLNINSAIFNFVTAGIYSFEIILIIMVIFIQKKGFVRTSPYDVLINDEIIHEVANT